MRVVAVARVLNEDDIIEAFVRHTLAFVGHIVLMDNGSTDRTLEILAALRQEGMPLTVMQCRSVFFNEAEYNTLIYRVADAAFQPDWILHLDTDEFIDSRMGDLHAALAAIPPEAVAAKLSLRNYFADGLDASELLIPRRMVLRDAADRRVLKCMLRGGLSEYIHVGAGNHDATFSGDPVAAVELVDIPLAHYPVRHPAQFVMKATLGRLKVLAAGAPAVQANHAEHYNHMLDALSRNPGEIFHDAARMANALPAIPLVEDPIRYLGSELRYTTATDHAMKALRTAANYAEQLATSHGRLLDASPEARARAQSAAIQAELLGL
ncbi:glycosyltransferase family 2 protein [Acidisphaera sp. L21]|uniref:glycosyltransferase family 2 protein n=1 Tax=Acidisphaera sp. L21 TaxID=1641851 RepID=UPI00131E7619|nr:glycosyltransferase family 2 protein [Acidisphaera sp. L21]